MQTSTYKMRQSRTEINKKLVAEFVAATNDRNWDKFGELVADNVIRRTSTSGQPAIKSRDQLKNFHKAELKTFPDIQENVIFLVAEGDMVAARINFRGTQLGQMGPFPPSGKVLDADFNCFFRVTANKISEVWVEYDNLNGLIQLGHYELPKI